VGHVAGVFGCEGAGSAGAGASILPKCSLAVAGRVWAVRRGSGRGWIGRFAGDRGTAVGPVCRRGGRVHALAIWIGLGQLARRAAGVRGRRLGQNSRLGDRCLRVWSKVGTRASLLGGVRGSQRINQIFLSLKQSSVAVSPFETIIRLNPADVLTQFLSPASIFATNPQRVPKRCISNCYLCPYEYIHF
jgi:hypothetical protein